MIKVSRTVRMDLAHNGISVGGGRGPQNWTGSKTWPRG